MQSLNRAMELLEHLKLSDKACSIAELAQLSALPPSTVHRILQVFHAKRYVLQDKKTHLYHLGPALIPLGIAATKRLNIQDLASSVLQSLMEKTGEDAFLAIKFNYAGLVLDKAEGPNSLKVVEQHGSEVPLHCGAIRRSLLAFLPAEEIEDYVRHGLTAYTENTITDPEKLLENLAEIRKNGVAVSVGEYIKDAVGVGAPVFDRYGKAVASIGIIVPVSRADSDRRSYFGEQVKKHAAELTMLMGSSGHK